MKLSIIVPVYGVEKYIEKCISSLLSPDSLDYEIVVVNDGTKDKSIDIIREKFNDQRIRIIEQENGGLSAARNKGLEHAKGEYVWFFDSDDWAETVLLPEIIAELEGIDALYMTKHYRYYEETGNEAVFGFNRNAISGTELIRLSYDDPVPFYIYKKDFLNKNNLWFTIGILHEDTLFTPMALPLVNILRCYNKPVYHYRQRGGSITTTVSSKRINDLLFISRSLVEYGQKLPEDLRYHWGRCIVGSTNMLLNLLWKSGQLNSHPAKEFLNNNLSLLKYFIHASTFNNRVLGVVAWMFHKKLIKVYSILARLRYR